MGYNPTFIFDAKDLPKGFGRQTAEFLNSGTFGERRFAEELFQELEGEDKMLKGLKIIAIFCPISSYVEEYRTILKTWNVPYVELEG